MTKLYFTFKSVFCLGLAFILFVFLSLVLPPLFQKNVDSSHNRNAEVFAESEPVKSNERVLNIENNDEALIWRLRLIENARSELVFTTFELGDDRSGREIMAALYNASQRGVRVRIIIDGFNAFFRLNNSDRFKALASAPNVEVKLYNEFSLLSPWELNYRMHDKLLVADGFAYILGGRNTNDLFLGNYREHYNLDRDILVYSENSQGGSVDAVKCYFEELWALDACTPLEHGLKDSELDFAREGLVECYRDLKLERGQLLTAVDWVGKTFEAERIELLTNPVNVGNKSPELWHSLSLLMQTGKEIRIQTPYIICDNEMYKTLASLTEGGARVSVMTNAIENGANPWGCSDYLNQKERIYSCGVGVYEFLGGQSLHSKTVLIDDNISVVGSFNLDFRSAYIDTETMLVIDCPELNSRLKACFDDAVNVCKFVSEEETSYGRDYKEKEIPFLKRAFLTVFRIIIIPFRYLL